MKRPIFIAAVTLIAVVPCPPQALADVETYYTSQYSTDPSNTFIADTGAYALQFSLRFASTVGLTIRNTGYPGENILLTSGTDSLIPALKVNGDWYSPAKDDAHEPKMINKKAGRVMWEVLVKDIKFKNAAGTALPLTAEQTFYLWEEKFYVKTAYNVTGTISGIEQAELQTFLNKSFFSRYNTGGADTTIPASGTWTAGAVHDHITIFDPGVTSHGALSYQVVNKTGTESLVMQSGGYLPGTADRIAVAQRLYDKDKHGGATATWTAGQKHTQFTQIFVSPANSSAAGVADTALETDPLGATELQVTNSLPYSGSKSLGYDNTIGAYTVQVYIPHLNFYKLEPNHYPSARIALTGDNKNRRVRLRTRLVGQYDYPAGVPGGTAFLTDDHMVPNGIPVQVSKKWDNADLNRWDAYSESYASFPLAAGASTAMWHRTAMQNWGNKVSVGLPSLDLDNYFDWGQLWLETNVGQSEAVCYLPDLPSNATVTDFRAINGRILNEELSPWFQNSGGHEFLHLRVGGSSVYAKRYGGGMRFLSGGPNLSQFQMTLRTPAGQPAATGTVTSTLLPSINGTRVFHKIRYDFGSDHTFSNVKRDLSLFSIGDLRYGFRANTLSYLGAGDTVASAAASHSTAGAWDVTGAPLSGTRPWIAFHDSTTQNNVGFVVHGFTGRFNGAAMNDLAVSMYSNSPDGTHANGAQAAYLVPSTAANTVKAGDYAEMMVEAYTWNPSAGAYAPLQTERDRWPTTVSVTEGTKLADFPARVAVGAAGYADLTVTGGADYLPITVEGFTGYAKPRLEEFVGGSWQVIDQSVGINDGWETDLDQATGKYNFTYAVPADGGTHRYKVSMVASTAPSLPAALPTPTWTNGGGNIALGKTYRASSQWDASYSAAKAFDNNAATRWSAANGQASNQWLEVDFGDKPQVFNKVVLTEEHAAAHIQSYKLQASDDGTVWYDITESPGTTLGPGAKTIEFYPVQFKRLRLWVNSTNGYPTIKEMAVYNTAHRALGKTYTASSTWNSGFAPANAFDQNPGSRWASASGQHNNQWLAVDFGAATTYRRAYIVEEPTAGKIQHFKLQSSTNGTSWTDIPYTTMTDGVAHPDAVVKDAVALSFAPITSQYVRLYVVTSNGNPNIEEFELYDFR